MILTSLDELLIFSGATLLVALILGRGLAAGWMTTVLYGGQLLVIIKMAALGYSDATIQASISFEIMGQSLSWRFDALSWFFALITVASALLSSWFSSGEWERSFKQQGGNVWLYHSTMALNVFTMLILLASGDLLSLFIGWELVTWAGFLLMAMAGGIATRAAMRYITYAMAGGMAIFGGIALVYVAAGSLQYEAILTAVDQMSTGQLWMLVLMFGGGFGIKMGLLPFHLWQAPAYAETPGPGSAFLGAISSRMGLFAILLVLVKLFGIVNIDSLKIPFTLIDARDLLAWIAVLTIILPTYTAMKQNDARYLLAWHGIGQGGYMLLGVVVANAMGGAGGLLHVFNYATCQAALFLAVTAVIHRTGTSDLNKLGGLVVRMPLSFMVLLVGIIGLAGLPPMNGFVSKWLVYRSLLNEGMPLLFLAAVIGTLGTILSVYKLIHNIFLGQLRIEHEQVKEAPWSMTIPMLILAAIIFITGLLPGIPLAWVASVQQVIGLPATDFTLGGIESVSGSLDMIWVIGVLFAGFGIGAVIFYSAGRSKRVHQLDNYAGGHFLSADVRYQYSDNFYAGLMHLIGGWYRGSFLWLEKSVISLVDFISLIMQGLYRRANAEFYLLSTALFVIAWVVI
ncbi:MAG: NADH dehydrogenase subunit [Candidatus Thiodiazotropha sp. (ex Lucinoma kastoroae)]|nr:NADH dehydrogenase subunit [Candidatus Thiodiazotropha sp. (ex Rostrolucina anterorostrata)]MCU7847314.1 NADH dehydrogenase subunit [Candidatus Thiodiazotropha sp. (ex Lucinoma kastoroae)]